VFVARAAGAVHPNPDEAMEHRWVSPDELDRWVGAAPWSVSPWLVGQLPGVLPVLVGGAPSRERGRA
jgi:isopentenyl-diphosphate delta-isomerase